MNDDGPFRLISRPGCNEEDKSLKPTTNFRKDSFLL
jgi:hypothetical protein